MSKKLPRLAVAASLAVGMLITPAAVFAAGNWSTLPQAEQPSFCGSTVTGTGGLGGITGQGQGTTGSICGQTIPAGPTSITGNETIPADTNLGSGINPATETIPLGLLAPGNSGANALTGADFGLNLWQRGIAPSANLTPSTASMAADGWYVYSSANTVSWAKETGSADVPTSLSPTLASFRVIRPTGSNTTNICMGQMLPQKESQRFIGNNSIFSIYALAGSGFSPTNDAVTMTVAYYTATDSATAQTNTNNFASSVGSTQNITGYAEVVNGVQNLSTTWTRYSVAASIPQTNSSGTTVTGVGVKVCWTPTGSGSTTDYVEFANAQYEPRGGTSVGPSAFNRRLPTEEWQLEYSRFFEIAETAKEVFHGPGLATGAAGAEMYVQTPVEQRLLVPTATYNAGFASLSSVGALNNCTALASVSGGVSALGAAIECTTTGLSAGNATFLVDNSGSGAIQISSEP